MKMISRYRCIDRKYSQLYDLKKVKAGKIRFEPLLEGKLVQI